jgi:tRNA 2-thiouridine synthesizing protein C
MKQYLFVSQCPPHQGLNVSENLDMILTCGAFDQSVALLLLDDAVLQLKQQQQSESNHLKDTAAIFQALDLYNINTIYVEMESLQARGLTTADLILDVVCLERAEVANLFQQFSVIISD